MNAQPSGNAFQTVLTAFVHAVQWRLWLLWLVLTGLPTLLVSIPAWIALNGRFGHSPMSADIAAGRAPGLLLDGLLDDGLPWAALSMGSVLATGLMLLLSPLLAAMAAAAWRTRGADLRTLLREGADGYGPMLRMLLWSVIPMGLVLAVGSGLMGVFLQKAASAVTPAELAPARWVFLGVVLPLLLVAHATVEAGRGYLAAWPQSRGAVRAWISGMRLLFKRPLALLLVEAITLAAVLLPLPLLVALRQSLDAASRGGWWLAWLVTCIGVLVVAWARIARLFGMASLARSLPPSS